MPNFLYCHIIVPEAASTVLEKNKTKVDNNFKILEKQHVRSG